MSQHQMTYAPAPTNGLAVAGFVCSLVGLFAGGLLSPVGLVLSLIALGREPRGMAIAGVIIGLIGSCGGLIILIVFGGLILAALGLAAAVAVLSTPQLGEVTADMATIAQAVEIERGETGYLPAGLESLGIDPAVLTDPWGRPYRYVLTDDVELGYDLVSDGQDGQQGTADDVRLSGLPAQWSTADPLVRVDGARSVTIDGRAVRIEPPGEDGGGGVTVDLGDRVVEIREGGVVLTSDADDGEEAEAGSP